MLFRVVVAGEAEPDEPDGFRLTDRQLDQVADLSRHHVGRKLAALMSAGWFTFGYFRIRLGDPKGLSAFA